MSRKKHRGPTINREERTNDGKPLSRELERLNHRRPASLAGLAVVITGIVPGFVGNQADHAAERRGARITKSVSARTELLVIGENAGRVKLNAAAIYNTPTITAREFLALL